ncbi:hypothetical protein [Dietzia maris]|uniref:Uncharacterized protein n=1 Tax=Dietzia maris TaxID=37915 RepID=A0ABT8H2Z7_9ACTN|nr:hypothetical protein [Dietzia maris]MDN4506825.1 hypothetical protein [Dietzia maris]
MSETISATELHHSMGHYFFTDHGHDTVAVCRDKAARGGNARLLTITAEHIDPC